MTIAAPHASIAALKTPVLVLGGTSLIGRFLTPMLAGADAFYSGIAGVLPKPMLALARAAQAGDADRVDALNAAFEPLWTLCKAHGGMRVSYALAGLLGLKAGLPPLPIQPLSGAVLDQLAKAMAQIEGAPVS